MRAGAGTGETSSATHAGPRSVDTNLSQALGGQPLDSFRAPGAGSFVYEQSAGPQSLFMLNDATADKIRCDACPVMCYIKPGAAGACDRYANHDGELVRVDPHVVLQRTVSHGGRLVPFQAGGE